ncbi:MAG: RNA methyltransferase [Bacteroidota bacterium]
MFRKLSMHQLNRLTIYQYQSTEKRPFVLVLDNVRSLNNVGSIFRSADGFGLSHIYLGGITGTPPHRDIHKTALGAENSIPWTHAADTAAICKQLKADGYTLIAVEQVEGSTMLQDFKADKTQKTAIVFGNEVDGVNEDVLALCDHCIEIPQFGTKHSFNVSVCAGIILWELLK